MEESLKVFKEVTQPLDEKQLKNVDKHYGLLNFIDVDTKKVLEEYNINYSKSDELILLTIKAMDMRRTLELAKNMGFIEFFQERPERLRQSITNIIKRIAKCEAEGIPYDKDNDFLFSEKLFNQKMIELNKNYVEDKEAVQEEQQADLNVILDIADALYEACPEIEEPKQNVMAAVQFVSDTGKYGPKEVLLKAFSKYTDVSNLNDKIDSILGINEEQTEGGRAA